MDENNSESDEDELGLLVETISELEYHEHFKECIDSAKKIGSISLGTPPRPEYEKLSFEDYTYLANELENSNIENINLNGYLLDDDELTVISAVLKNTKIKNLNLKSNKFGINGLSALSSALKESKIEVLNLSDNSSIRNDINILTDSLPFSNVTSLNLGAIDISFCCIKHLSNVLAETKITDLSLECCCLGDVGIEYLSKKLPNSKIQSLNLANNEMFDSIQSLADVLENTAITELNVSRNEIDSTGATYLAGKLSKSVLQSLDIGHNLMESEGCLAIGNVIHLTQIIKLNLGTNSIDSNGITSLAENLKKSNVKYLSLDGNNLQIDGAQILANGIIDSDLENLNVNRNQLGNVGMGIILDSLQFTKITDFDLSCESNGMNAENMKLVTNAFKFFKLKNLHLVLPEDENINQLFFKELKTLIESNNLDEILSIKNKMNFLIDINFQILRSSERNIFDVIKHFHMRKLRFNNNGVYFSASPIVNILIDIKNPISNITTLNLYDNYIGDRGAIILAENFKYLQLTRLELEVNVINNDGVIAIANELENSRIRYLNLSFNDFNYVGTNYLTNVIEKHPVRIELLSGFQKRLKAEKKLVIQNINCMFLKAKLLVQSISDNSPVNYDKDMIEHLKAYEIFKNVDLLWESACGKHKYDYNKINSQIRSNVTKNFLKIIGVVDSDEINSDLLPTELIIKICSYLKINDIKFN